MRSDMGVGATNGVAGKVMGVIFETEGWGATHLVVETGGSGLPEHQRAVPAALIEQIDWDGRVIRLGATVARVNDSPDLHEMDGLEGKWFNKVLAYYGAQS